MSHVFGDLLTQHLHRQHGLSQSKLALGIDQDPAVISAMCRGARLRGSGARERVVRIIGWLREQGVLANVTEAEALLAAADMTGLRAADPEEAALLQALVRPAPPRQFPDPAVPQYAPPHFAAGATTPPASLPASLTSFVGREEACDTVRTLLRESRLVTLLGPGGIGKTRLALEIAGSLATVYADGVYLVELGPLREGELVPQAVAGALGVRAESGRHLIDTLVSHLRQRKVLIVLDNCEHLVEASAAVASVLLRGCPGLSILATSREILRVSGESPWPVPPLALPAPTPYSEPPLPLAAMISPENTPAAVQLFADRARRARPGWELTAANIQAVIQICQRLDGLPLALELAAACTRALTVEQIAVRLDRRFNLLQGGNRNGLPHHQTLQATIAWSDDLLASPERTLFARLGVFASGWTLEAAEAICSGSPVAVEDLWTLLAALVDKSLVVAEEHNGIISYRMLETIREYARTRSFEEAIPERMIQYFVDYVEDHATDYAALDGEMANILEALTLAQNRNAPALVTGVNALYHFLETRGWYDLANELLAHAVTAARNSGDHRALATVLLHQGRLAERQGQYPQAESLYREGLALARAYDDDERVSALLQNLGGLAMRQGDYEQAEAVSQDGLSLARKRGDRERISALLGNLAAIEVYNGSSAKADVYYHESLALAREIGNKERTCALLQGLGVTAANRGEYEQAEVYLTEGLDIARSIGHQERLSHLLVWLAAGALSRGDADRAEASLQEGLAVARTIKNRERMSHLLVNLGNVALHQGDLEKAGNYLQESVSLARMIDHQERLSQALQIMSALARRSGDHEQAGLLLKESLALARALGHRRLVCSILSERGELELESGHPKAASETWNEALTFARAIGSVELEAVVYYGLARAAAAIGDSSEAQKLGEAGLAIFAAIGHAQAPTVENWLKALLQQAYTH